MAKNEPVAHRVNVYLPLVRCGNCDLFQKIEINQGIVISQTCCPNCRCKTLQLVGDREITKYPSYL